jgi:hypothetical protein
MAIGPGGSTRAVTEVMTAFEMPTIHLLDPPAPPVPRAGQVVSFGWRAAPRPADAVRTAVRLWRPVDEQPPVPAAGPDGYGWLTAEGYLRGRSARFPLRLPDMFATERSSPLPTRQRRFWTAITRSARRKLS